MSLSEYIIVMNHGRAEALANRQDVYASPEVLFVARFLGRINLLRVTIRRDSDSFPPRIQGGRPAHALPSRASTRNHHWPRPSVASCQGPGEAYAGVTHRQQGYPPVPLTDDGAAASPRASTSSVRRVSRTSPARDGPSLAQRVRCSRSTAFRRASSGALLTEVTQAMPPPRHGSRTAVHGLPRPGCGRRGGATSSRSGARPANPNNRRLDRWVTSMAMPVAQNPSSSSSAFCNAIPSPAASDGAEINGAAASTSTATAARELLRLPATARRAPNQARSRRRLRPRARPGIPGPRHQPPRVSPRGAPRLR